MEERRKNIQTIEIYSNHSFKENEEEVNRKIIEVIPEDEINYARIKSRTKGITFDLEKFSDKTLEKIRFIISEYI